MACGWAKAAVAASYAGVVASFGVEFASAGTLTLVAAGGLLLSVIGLISSLSELHTCLIQQDKLEEAHKIEQQINNLSNERDRLKQLLGK